MEYIVESMLTENNFWMWLNKAKSKGSKGNKIGAQNNAFEGADLKSIEL